jgi:N-acetylglucosaminyldiphosphoundecaprenol N-acetyl-beta-D-mannosaminyltransferase
MIDALEPVKRRKSRLFGISIDSLTMDEALREIEILLASPQPSLVVTPNIQHISLLQRDAEFKDAYAAASLILADSMPLVWSSRLLGSPLPERVAGSDILPAFSRRAARKGYGLFFLGAAPGIAARAANVLREKNPGLRIVGVHAPGQGFERHLETNEEVLRLIREARPDILFVALGTPKGEVWAWKNKNAASVPVVICCGAALDFISGNKRRSPRWLQKLGLEWLFRVLHEPRRLWRRYLSGNIHFIILLARELVTRKKAPKFLSPDNRRRMKQS